MDSARMEFPFPRRFLRDLFVACELGIGSRLLDVGCGTGEMAAFCHSLGIECTGIDDRSELVERGAAAHPEVELHCGTLENSIPFAAHHFDVALVRGMHVYTGDLSALEAFASTANLLASLKPGGRMVVLVDDAMAGLEDAENERQKLFIDHFASFPGECVSTEYAEGIGRFISLGFLLGRRARLGHRLVTMTVPRQPMTKLQWHNAARTAVLGRMHPAA